MHSSPNNLELRHNKSGDRLGSGHA